VALARALIHEPRLVLFDEALSNLDAQLREQMRMELSVLQNRLGFTAIYVTHDQSEAFGLADRIIVMNRGHIDTEGEPRDVFERPRTPFVAQFLGLNVQEGEVVEVASTPPFAVPASPTPGWAQVALPGGTAVWGKLGQDRPLTAGCKALICIRKEHVRVSSDSAGDPQAFSAVVRAASFQGLVEEYIVDVAGMELRAIQPSAGVRSGDAVTVGLSPDQCIVLAGEA